MKKLLEGTCVSPAKFDRQWDLSYDGDGTRVGTVLTTFDPDTQAIAGTAVTSYFMAGLYEETDGVARKYYAISGMTVAMSDAEGMKYLLTDHLGSVAAITDDEGTLLDQQRYLPFGAERPNVGMITQTDFGYTGQRDLVSMGLMDYKARAYDPLLMRFIQPDTIIPNPADPQGWNRLAYVRGNPIRFSDPTGHYIVEEGDCTQLSCSGDPSHPKKLQDELSDQESDSQPQDLFGNFGEEGCDVPGQPCTASVVHMEPTCIPFMCVMEAYHGLDAMALGGMVAYIGLVGLVASGSTAPWGLVAAPAFAVMVLVGVNFALFGYQVLSYPETGQEPDPLVLVHYFFPDFGRH